MGNNQPSARKKTYYISLAILAGMFFIFGFVSWVNSILIPYFRISCELTHFESYFLYSILCHGHSFGHSIEESWI